MIILHVGNQNDFIDGAGLVYPTTDGVLGDYNGDMDGKLFKKRFEEELLLRLLPSSVIVMDNASYHSVEKDKAPTSNSAFSQNSI